MHGFSTRGERAFFRVIVFTKAYVVYNWFNNNSVITHCGCCIVMSYILNGDMKTIKNIGLKLPHVVIYVMHFVFKNEIGYYSAQN